ncbi:MAG TPA: ADOP family duplicated permease [Bryobacteraceae bacterium]
MGLPWLDLRTAFRMLRKSPGATALAVVSIALAIGLTTSVFSLADAMFLRPFAIAKPGEVLTAESRGDDGQPIAYGWPDWEDMARAAQGVAELSVYERMGAILAGDEGDQHVLIYPVSPNHFSFLGVKAGLGRASFDTVAGRPAAVIGSRLWQRRFGGDPHIVGKTILINKQAFAVAGVMPDEFTGLVRGVASDVWVSTDDWFGVLHRSHERQERSGNFEIIARLKPGISAERLAAQLDAAIRGPGKHKPAPGGAAPTFLSARFAMDWRQDLTSVSVLALALGLVLFAGCANAAQLRMAQAEERRRELAMRQALGAGTWRVMRLLLVESALIGMAGASLGLLLARFLIDSALGFFQGYYQPELRLDTRVLAFAVAACAASVLLAGLTPVRHAVRLKLNEVLKADQGVTGARKEWRKRALVVGQIAVSVLFFGLAVQFVESARNAAAIRPGLDPSKKIFIISPIPGWHLPEDPQHRRIEEAQWCEQACARLNEVPGVRGTAYARRLPLSGSGDGMTARVEMPGQAPLGVFLNNVGGTYFSLMGTRVVAGRGIDTNDRQNSPLVAVVSQQLARRLFPGRNPVGQSVRIDGKMREIVGVAEDGPASDLHEKPEPYLFLPFTQAPSGDLILAVETTGEPYALMRPILRQLKRFDPATTIYGTTTLRRTMDQRLAGDRMMASAATTLGAIGLVLTAAGLFGVVQYRVNRRRREIGLRMALGARASEIRGMVLRESLRIAVWGIPLGLAMMAGGAHTLRSLMLGVEPLGPLAYLLSAAAAAALAALAAWLPAARAARVDPMAALRSE